MRGEERVREEKNVAEQLMSLTNVFNECPSGECTWLCEGFQRGQLRCEGKLLREGDSIGKKR